MPLGTIDRTPPPFFRQGHSALTKLVFFAALAVFLMVADNRLALVQSLRATLATVLHPVQRGMLVPIDMVAGGTAYPQGLETAIASESEAKLQLTRQAERAAHVEQLQAENAR